MSYSGLGGAARGRAKGKMRPPRKTGPDMAIEESWQKLAHAIKEIQKHNASKLSFEESYRYSYNMVLYKHGDKLYAGVKQLIAEHLRDLAEEKIVPTFPRSGVMTMASGVAGPSTSTAGPSSSSREVGVDSMGGTSSGVAGAQSVEMVVEGERFLQALKFVWDDHSASMNQLTQVLRYMDKVHSPHANVPQCAELGLQLFLSQIIHSNSFPIQSHLLNVLLTQIHLERLGEIINRSAMRDTTDILCRLEVKPKKSVYDEDFEAVFLKRSEEFYREESGALLENYDASTYLKKVDSRISEEQNRCAHYLTARTLSPLHLILDTELLSNHLTTILNMPGSGLVPMLDDDKYGDLQRLYKLFGRPNVTEGPSVLKSALKKSIAVRGDAINEGITGGMANGSSGAPAGTTANVTNGDMDAEAAAATSRAKGKGKETDGSVSASGTGMSAAAAASAALRWVQDVLDLKDKFDRILRDGFSDDKGVQTAINEAFQTFINENKKAPEYISLFIDENLKKGLKGKTEDEVDLVLEKTIILFRFLLDKDVFERYYKAHLAKRLLNNRSVSEDAERNMVAKLKVESGYQFTQKLEGMFNDMRLSSDTMKAFERHLGKVEPLGYDLGVTVLTSTYWPGETIQSTCNLSPILTRGLQTFERFYVERHSGRKLTWQANLGSADVKVQFRNRAHELNVSTYGLVVLLLFEDLEEGEELSLQDIKSATQIPDADLCRALQSLACGKYRILTKNPRSRDVNPADKFSFNVGFTCPLAKIKIQTIVGKVENGAERAETQEKVDEERRHQIEACIVRIMKDRKTMTHNDLIHEVARQLMARFNPPPSAIKKRIESLIDREYLARDGMKSYQYLA